MQLLTFITSKYAEQRSNTLVSVLESIYILMKFQFLENS